MYNIYDSRHQHSSYVTRLNPLDIRVNNNRLAQEVKSRYAKYIDGTKKNINHISIHDGKRRTLN